MGGRDLSMMPENTVRQFVPGDGDCLLHAFKDGCEAAADFSVQDLRNVVHEVMTTHRNLFSGVYARSENYGELEFNEYLAAVLEREYGDDLFVMALAMKFKTQIHIFRQSIGCPKVIVWDFSPVEKPVSEPVMIWNLVRNNGGDHYDALSFAEGRMVLISNNSNVKGIFRLVTRR